MQLPVEENKLFSFCIASDIHTLTRTLELTLMRAWADMEVTAGDLDDQQIVVILFLFCFFPQEELSIQTARYLSWDSNLIFLFCVFSTDSR